jgi:hypothetical protein
MALLERPDPFFQALLGGRLGLDLRRGVRAPVFQLLRPGRQHRRGLLLPQQRQLDGGQLGVAPEQPFQFPVPAVLRRHLGQGVALAAGVLQLPVDPAQMAEVLRRARRRGEGRRDVQHLVAEEPIHTLVEALAVLQRAEQAEGLVIVDAEPAAEPLGEGLMDVEGFAARQGRLEGGGGEAASAVVLQSGRVERPVVDDVVLADLAFETVGRQVEQCSDAHLTAQAVVVHQGDGRPRGAGTLVGDPGGGLGLAPAHVAVRGAPVLPVAGLVGGLVQARCRIENVLDAVEQGGLAHAGVAGQQGAGPVDVHGVPPVERAPVDHLDAAQPVLARVDLFAQRQRLRDAHSSSSSSSAAAIRSVSSVAPPAA